MKPLFAFVLLSLTPLALSQEGDCDSLEKCQDALKTKRTASLIHFRLGEIFFAEKKYQQPTNEFREALNGDLKPKWVQVWAHVNLGKIFDITGQRDRALDQYRLAMETGDNTRGAQDEATKYTQEPYKRD
jgi:tetratricopeptide (TPR) repeat protein